MRIFIGGGCKNGKSTLAQRLAVAQGNQRFYLATMRPRDAEDEARIIRHRKERLGWGFETIECPRDIRGVTGVLPRDASLLLDSSTALLAETMFTSDGQMDPGAAQHVAADLLALADAHAHLVVVTDTIGADAESYTAETEAYRRGLAQVDRALAQAFDAVVEVVFGVPVFHKGGNVLAAWLQADASRAGDGAWAIHGPAGVRPLG